MSKAARSVVKLTQMRILALPLTSGAPSSSLHAYYHFQMPPPVGSKGKPSSLLKRVTRKAAEIWEGFGKAPEGNWRQRTFKYGERIMDRIDFVELALKSMDPSLGPKLTQLGDSGAQLEEKDSPSITLIYPTFFGSKLSPLQHLQELLKERTPSHRKGFYFWMLISPLTAPFILIPNSALIPNLPFFFCAWRSWHHYRAFKASSYLESLLERGAIEPDTNSALDRIYETYLTFFPFPPGSDPSTSHFEKKGKEHVMLRREAVPKIVSLFELPPSAEADLYRALDQTTKRLKKLET